MSALMTLLIGISSAVAGGAATYFFTIRRAKRQRKVIHWTASPPARILKIAEQPAEKITFRDHEVQQLMRYVFQLKNAGHDHIEKPGEYPLTWTPPLPDTADGATPMVLAANVLSLTPSTAPKLTLKHVEAGQRLEVRWGTLNPGDTAEIEVLCDCNQSGVGSVSGQFPDTRIVEKERSYSATADDEHRRLIRIRIVYGIVAGILAGLLVHVVPLFVPDGDALTGDWSIAAALYEEHEGLLALAVGYAVTGVWTFIVYRRARLGKRVRRK